MDKTEPVIIDHAEIIKLTVKAVKDYEQKQRAKDKESRHSWKLRNTRLLLKHYNYFQDHIDESIYSSDQMESIDIIAEIEDCNASIDIRSIKKSAHKTFVIMSHIDSMLDLYRSWADRLGELEQRKYRVLKMYFIDNFIIPDILKAESISESTFYRDIDGAIDTLSTLIFGIEASHLMTE